MRVVDPGGSALAGRRRRQQQRQPVGPVQHDPAVVLAQRAGADPDDLARRAQFIEQPRRVTRTRAGRMSRSSTLAGSGTPSSWAMTSASRSMPPRAAPTPCQLGRKRASAAGSTGSISRRSLASERRRRSAQHLRIAPLALDATRPELAAQQRAVGERVLQLCLYHADRHSPARRGLGGQERAVVARPAREQPTERIATGARNASGTPLGGARRPHPGSGPRPPWRSSAAHRRCRTCDRPPIGGQRLEPLPGGGARELVRQRHAPARPPRRRSGRPGGAGGRGPGRPNPPPARLSVTAARAPARPARRRRAARAARRHPGARAAGRGRAPAPARAGRPAARRPRTCRRRCSRTSASWRTARRAASRR